MEKIIIKENLFNIFLSYNVLDDLCGSSSELYTFFFAKQLETNEYTTYV